MFKVGDTVTTNFDHSPKPIRTVTKVKKDSLCYSGFRVSVSAGLSCPHCGAIPGRPITLIDSEWFEKVETEKK